MSRFVRPEPVDGSTRVVRVLDAAHVAHRACRTVRAGEAPFEEVRDRLRRLARIRHPHLVGVVAVGEEDGELKVVTEWLPGGALLPDDAHRLAGLLVGPAEALYALHREGLAHGHVEPRSFVLDGEGVVKLVDGGVRDGSVHEDLVAFGAALRALHAGRPVPAAVAEVASRAVAGGFGDARELADALRAAAEVAPAPGWGHVDLPSEDARVVDTAPPARERVREEDEEEPERRWLLLLLLAMLSALLVVGVSASLGWWVGTRAPSPPVVVAPSPVPAVPVTAQPPPAELAPPNVPAPAPERASPRPSPRPVVVPTPAVEPAPLPVIVVAPPPAPVPQVVVVEPVPVAAEVHVPAPPPPPAPVAPPPAPQGTAWRVTTSPGRLHPVTTLVLDASNDVGDHAGRVGRPRLEIRCQERKLSVTLFPGVQSVEAVPSEVGVYSLTADVLATRDAGAGEPARLRMTDGDPRLAFPQPDRWVARLATGHAWYLSYTPFASAAVVADFETEGLETVLPEIARYCRL